MVRALNTLLKALLIPWGFASISFVAISSVLLAWLHDKGVLGLMATYFLLAWLFKYAYVLLEHVANGAREAPAVSTDMLGPMEQRPWIQASICFAVYLALHYIGGVGVAAISVLLLSLLPASMAVLGIGESVPQALNPLMLWRMIRGLGLYYLAILAMLVTVGLLIAALTNMDAWTVLTVVAAEVAVLTVFSALGGAVFERRLELGFEPLTSPERQKDRDDIEHRRLLDRMLDELYTAVKMKRRSQALALLNRWLGHSDDAHVGSDAFVIVRRAAGWRQGEGKLVSQVAEVVITELARRDRADLARELRAMAIRDGIPPQSC